MHIRCIYTHILTNSSYAKEYCKNVNDCKLSPLLNQGLSCIGYMENLPIIGFIARILDHRPNSQRSNATSLANRVTTPCFPRNESEKVNQLAKQLLASKDCDPSDVAAAKDTVKQEIPSNLSENSDGISIFPREPLVNCEKKSNLTLPGQKFAKFVSYERFVFSLKKAFSTTLESIPPKEPYIILKTSKGKSMNWVISHLLGMMEKHPPLAIVRKTDLKSYLAEHPEIKHVVLADDGGYSGEQVSRHIGELSVSNFTLHICIPYMTSYAKKRIISTCERENVSIHFSDHQIMLSYAEMGQLGYYNYQQIPRPNIKHLLSMNLPFPGKDWSKEERWQYKQIKGQILTLKKNVFKLSDEAVNQELKTIENELVQILRVTNLSASFKDRVEKIKGDIEETLKLVLRYKGTPEIVDEDQRTPAVMSHKYADYLSINAQEMKGASKTKKAIPPYKEDKENCVNRYMLIISLHEQEIAKNRKTLDQAYEKTGRLAGEQIVQSNRGCFILSNSYVQTPLTDDEQITLCIGNQRFPFGGATGLPQWRLEEGQEIILEKNILNSKISKTLRYANGELFVTNIS